MDIYIFQRAAFPCFASPTIQTSASAPFPHIRLAAQMVRALQMSGFSRNCGVKFLFFPQEEWDSVLAQGKFAFFGGWGPHICFSIQAVGVGGCWFSATTAGPNPPSAGLTTSWDGVHARFPARTMRTPQIPSSSHNRRPKLPAFSVGKMGQCTGPRGVCIFRGMGTACVFLSRQ